MDLAERLIEGLAALRGAEAARAAEILAGVCADPDLSTQPDLADVYARACSLHAQALLMAGRAAEARRPLRAALDALTALHDTEGLRAVGELERQIGEAVATDFQQMARRREQRALAARSLDDAVAGCATASARADAAIRWSGGALADGRADDAAMAAREAARIAAQAGDVRHEVLARIAWATADPSVATEQLERARASADAVDEFNLVGAVAKAAGHLGVNLPAPPDPESA